MELSIIDKDYWIKLAKKRAIEELAYEMGKTGSKTHKEAQEEAPKEFDRLKKLDENEYYFRINIADILNRLDEEVGKRNATDLINHFETDYNKASVEHINEYQKAIGKAGSVSAEDLKHMDKLAHKKAMKLLPTYKLFEGKINDEALKLVDKYGELSFSLWQHRDIKKSLVNENGGPIMPPIIGRD